MLMNIQSKGGSRVQTSKMEVIIGWEPHFSSKLLIIALEKAACHLLWNFASIKYARCLVLFDLQVVQWCVALQILCFPTSTGHQ